MNKELLERSDQLWERSDRADRFSSKFKVYPISEAGRLVDDFQRLSDDITEVGEPATTEEVYGNELKRRLTGEAVRLDHSFGGHYYTLEDVTEFYGIESEDIDNLQDWLLTNRDGVLESIDRVFKTSPDIKGYRSSVPGDIPEYRRRSEEIAAGKVDQYHTVLSRLFESQTGIGGFMNRIKSKTTDSGRSYFDTKTRILALDIPLISYFTDAHNIEVDPRELIRVYGHEGMGHGLNTFVTDASDLPNFLKRDTESTRATAESVAQHYEEVIFEDLANSPETQKELDIEHKFESIHQNQKDTLLIETFNRRLFSYVIKVLSNKSLGDMNDPAIRKEVMERKIGLISEVALYPGYAMGMVEGTQQSFDSKGNLSAKLMGEIIYAARPAQNVVEVLENKGLSYSGDDRSKIDRLLLTGFWTPIGLTENAKVAEA